MVRCHALSATRNLRKPPRPQATEVGAIVPAENHLHVYDWKTQIKFLIDSGSLLPKSILRKKPLTLYAANDLPIATSPTYAMMMNSSLQGPYSWQFIIAGVQSAIIGTDFLSKHGLLIDIRGKRL